MGAFSTSVETVTIPKKLWEDNLESQPWLLRKAAAGVVIHEGTFEQLQWWVKAGIGIAAFILVMKYGAKILKV